MLTHSSQCDQSYDDTALPYRCVSVEGGDNCRHQTAGSSMARCLGGPQQGRPETSQQSHDRVTNDAAREYLNRSRGGTMNLSVDGTSVSSKQTISQLLSILDPSISSEPEGPTRGRRILQSRSWQRWIHHRPEPEQGIFVATASCQNQKFRSSTSLRDQSRGHVVDCWQNELSSRRSQAEEPRNDTGGREEEANDGLVQPRGIIGANAQEAMKKSMGSSMKELVENYRLQGDPPARQKGGASGYEDTGLARTASVGNLLTDYGKKTPPVVPPLRLHGLALEVADKHRSKDFFKTIQQRPPTK